LVGSEPVLLQEPLQQTSRRLHAVPHEPQLERSVFVSTQVPLHIVRPEGHCAVHTPFWQVSVKLQTLLQAPQFSGSELVLMQVPLHLV